MRLMSLISGLLFGIGLVISGMVNPDKVKGFLDITRAWDASLMFVMGGAVVFNYFSFKYIKSQPKPLTGDIFHWPTIKKINKRLIIGSTIFGIGWGIGGICPGPGVVNLVTLDPKAITFVASMIAGMFLFKLFDEHFLSKQSKFSTNVSTPNMVK